MVGLILSFFVAYLLEDGRKMPKHVGVLPHVRILLYLITVHLLEYILTCLTAWNMDNINLYLLFIRVASRAPLVTHFSNILPSTCTSGNRCALSSILSV